MPLKPNLGACALAAAILALCCNTHAQSAGHQGAGADKKSVAQQPWMDKSLSPDQRADLVLKQMTLDEKITLLHGNGMAHVPNWQMPLTNMSNGGAGYIAPIERLGIPGINMSDAAYGVRSSGENGRYSTALPSNAGAAASWDRKAAYEYGALIGRELRAQGYNMTLGGGVNLTREPRNGRTFEYLGEDPVLAGTLVGQLMTGEQAQHVIGDIKHYAINDQETGRNIVNAIISKRAMRETDLLAFQIGIRDANPGAVMCSYNRINGDYACENDYLLHEVLKTDFKFPGFVVSDWAATHSTVKASHAGLDNEEPLDTYYGAALKKAVQAGEVSEAELNDHARRLLRSYFADGVIDYPVQKSVVDVERDLDISQHIEEGSIVLLRNEGNILPLAEGTHKIAMIGAHADIGMLSGGGSAQVDPPGGNAIMPPGEGETRWGHPVWFPTSPLKELRMALPSSTIQFDAGTDPSSAAALARQSDVAIVFVQQWESEGMDLPTLTLPDQQNALVEAVATANPHTIVVLETGSVALMPWSDKVQGIIETWYSGSRGARALANVMTGVVNPSGKTANTFPLSDADLPHTSIPPLTEADKAQERNSGRQAADERSSYEVKYDEGLKVGYKWYDAEHKPVLFPFGFGLSYTTFSYSGLKVSAGEKPSVQFTLKNTGSRSGAEVTEVYAMLPTAAVGEPPKRLVGFDKIMLHPGESREVSITIDPLFLSIYDDASGKLKVIPGQYTFAVGGSSQSLPLKAEAAISAMAP